MASYAIGKVTFTNLQLWSIGTFREVNITIVVIGKIWSLESLYRVESLTSFLL